MCKKGLLWREAALQAYYYYLNVKSIKRENSLPTVTDCSTALTGRLFSFWIGNWITHSNSSFENCKTMFLFPLQYVPNNILFIAQFQRIVPLLYTHTEHLGFWNWFPPLSGWLEQPWLVFHTPISIASQQLTAGSLDQVSLQPSEQLPGKGQYFWATDGYACHGCYSLGTCYRPTDTCSDMHGLWVSFLAVLKSLEVVLPTS